MSLVAGTRLGPFEIQSAIGEGGMGQVYKARDTRLDRTVAIKLLPPDVSAHPERRARFEREAKTAGSLNHPHICTLYDIGDHDGAPFLVMELLVGETLADRLKRGPLPLEQALKIATELADALSAAHRQGIVHRDLKPGNVVLTKAGAKLLDFGLAKLTGHGEQPAVAHLASEATRAAPLTGEGTIVGTLQYMAPEQLEGKAADQRTDIWALGAILYEMLTGRRAFEATSVVGVMGAILEREPPPLASLEPLTPVALDRLVRRCLSKLPDDRPDTAHDLADGLRSLADTSASRPSVSSRPHRAIISPALLTLALVSAVGLGVALAMLLRPKPAVGREVVRALVSVEPAARLQSNRFDVTIGEQRPSQTAFALSPDGRLMAFTGVVGDVQHLYLRPLDRLEARAIDGTDGAASPFFSPDGKWIGFSADGALKKIAVAGGPPTTICQVKGWIFGASWGDDDSILFSENMSVVFRVPAAGGNPSPVTKLDEQKGEVSHRLPCVLPGARAVLFTAVTHYLPDWDDARIEVQPTAGGAAKTVARGADARYLPTGHLIFVRSGNLVAVPFSLDRLEVTGGEVTVLSNVMQAANTPNSAVETGVGQFAVSSSGLLAYAPGGIFQDQERRLAWVDRSGTEEMLPLPPRAYLGPRLSPDGNQILLWTQGRERVVWTYDLRRGTTTRVTTEGRCSRSIWAPDGRRATFAFATGGFEELALKAADGGGTIERLPARGQPSSWSPDGKVLAYVHDPAAMGRNSVFLLSTGDPTPRRLGNPGFGGTYPEFSPDGRWIAYVSDETGRNEVYVEAYGGPGPRRQLSNNGGSQPAWSRGGRELFYTEIDAHTQRTRMMSVALGPGMTPGVPRLLFEGQFRGQANTRGYDVTPDGRRFLMVKPIERPPSPVTHVVIVQNWFEELRNEVGK